MTYSIGEVAKMFRISPQTLRNYEKLGLIPRSQRRPTNRREYEDADIEAIKPFFHTKAL